VNVLVAESLGMCFGVRDAVEAALASPHRAELTVLGELVHNRQVQARLRQAGVRSVASTEEPVATPWVMITAHGTSHATLARLRERGLQVAEATCPLVRHAHRCLARLVAQSYFPVVVGDPGHVEVRGLVGDFPEHAVIASADDLGQLAGRERLGVVSQTTQPLDHVQGIVAAIRAAYPRAEVRFIDTVCQPTKERQGAARRLAARCEVVIVVGGRSSNNTRQLARRCADAGARVHQVETASEIRLEWLAGAHTVGLTAGTSTPDDVIAAVHRALLTLADGVGQAEGDPHRSLDPAPSPAGAGRRGGPAC
jgi:4-hydroxy-3-methylbut-2-enyl diphosphate reductase